MEIAEEHRRSRYRAQIIAAGFSLRLSEAHMTRQRLADTDEDLQGGPGPAIERCEQACQHSMFRRSGG